MKLVRIVCLLVLCVVLCGAVRVQAQEKRLLIIPKRSEITQFKTLTRGQKKAIRNRVAALRILRGSSVPIKINIKKIQRKGGKR